MRTDWVYSKVYHVYSLFRSAPIFEADDGNPVLNINWITDIQNKGLMNPFQPHISRTVTHVVSFPSRLHFPTKASTVFLLTVLHVILSYESSGIPPSILLQSDNFVKVRGSPTCTLLYYKGRVTDWLQKCRVLFFKILFSVLFEESWLQRCKLRISVKMVKPFWCTK